MNRRLQHVVTILKPARKPIFILSGFLSILLLIFTLIIYNNARKDLFKEFLNYNEYEIDKISGNLEDYLYNMRWIVASIYEDPETKKFMTGVLPNETDNGKMTSLKEKLQTFKNSYSAIDSIYIYSAITDQVLESQNTRLAYRRESLEDKEAFVNLENLDRFSYRMIMRKKIGMYPYLLSIYKTISTKQGLSCVMLNLNLGKVCGVYNKSRESSQQMYIISKEGLLLYYPNQRDILIPASEFPQLVDYYPGQTDVSKQMSKGNPYIYTLKHSKEYQWDVVLITEMRNYEEQLSQKRAVYISILFAVFMVGLLFTLFFVLSFFKPVYSVMKFLNDPELYSNIVIKDKELKQIIPKILTFINRNKELSDNLEKQMKQLSEAQLLALQTQINPHFIFNTLNMIRMLEIQRLGYHDDIPEMTLILSKILHYSLESENLVSLKTEFYYVELFTKLMEKRYQNEIQFVVELSEDVEDVLIPKLSLQPLIENAIFHGLSGSNQENKTVQVSAALEDGICSIKVRDNGVGMEAERLDFLRDSVDKEQISDSNRSIGLHNVNLRLKLLFGDRYRLVMESHENSGTQIELQLKAN